MERVCVSFRLLKEFQKNVPAGRLRQKLAMKFIYSPDWNFVILISIKRFYNCTQYIKNNLSRGKFAWHRT
jgi:hypothetical protein